jgi:hypothetical protein
MQYEISQVFKIFAKRNLFGVLETNLKLFLFNLITQVPLEQDIEQGCTTQFSWRAPKKFLHARGLEMTCLLHIKWCFMKETGLRNKQDFWLCGPDLVLGPLCMPGIRVSCSGVN